MILPFFEHYTAMSSKKKEKIEEIRSKDLKIKQKFIKNFFKEEKGKKKEC